MAKTQKEWTPKRVRSEDERSTGASGYISLKDGEKFLGYALFEGDPAKDEPGYYEYLEHWVTGGKGHSVPCAGDNCPFCEDGDKPRDRAKSLWLVTMDEDGDKLDPPELRIFNLNSIIIKQITEMRGESDKVKGRLFRVSRTDDRGNYVLMPKQDILKAAEVKEHLSSKDVPDFDRLVTSSLRKEMEGTSLKRALEDNDDDENEKPDKKKGGKKGGKKKESDEWPETLDEVEVKVVEVEKKGNYFTASHDDYDGNKDIYTNDDIKFDLSDLSEDDLVTVSADIDGDGDYILNDEPETEGGGASVEDIEDETFDLVKVSKAKNFVVVEHEGDEITLNGTDEIDVSEWKKGDTAKISAEYDSEEEEWTLTSLEEEEEEGGGSNDDLPDAIEDEELIVVSVDASESTIEVKNDDLEFTLYFLDSGPAAEVDFDDYEEGAKIKVSAEKDSSGDLVATTIPELVKDKKKSDKKGGKAGKKSSGKKTDKKKGGKKK